MSYLSCPSCGLTIFDRNPLTSPRRCPRCARRGLTVELERVAKRLGAAAASVLGWRPPQSAERSEETGD